MLIHSGLGTLLSSLAIEISLLHLSKSWESARSNAWTSWMGPSSAVEQSRGRAWGKQVRLQVASNPDGKYLLWVSGKSSIFLFWVFHDWVHYYVLGVIGVNRLLKKRRPFILSCPGDECVFYICFYSAFQSEAQGPIWLQPGICQTYSRGGSWGEKCLRDPWRERFGCDWEWCPGLDLHSTLGFD